jgi:hypothetical protein
MEAVMYGHAATQTDLTPVITDLCKGVIREAHESGPAGRRETQAFGAFEQYGASTAQFDMVVGTMVRAGLLERRADHTLHATNRGLAYVGIAAS